MKTIEASVCGGIWGIVVWGEIFDWYDFQGVLGFVSRFGVENTLPLKREGVPLRPPAAHPRQTQTLGISVLQLMQPIVYPLQCQQLLMPPLLPNPPVVHDDNLVGIANR